MIYNVSSTLKINLNFKGRYFTFAAGEQKVLTAFLSEKEEQDLAKRHAELVYIPNKTAKKLGDTLTKISNIKEAEVIKEKQAAAMVDESEVIAKATTKIFKEKDIIDFKEGKESFTLTEGEKRNEEPNYFEPVKENEAKETIEEPIIMNNTDATLVEASEKKKAGRPKKNKD